MQALVVTYRIRLTEGETITIWVVYTLRSSRSSLGVFAFFLVAAFVAETLLQRYQGRRILADTDAN